MPTDIKVQIDGDKNPQIPSIPEILTNFKAVLAGITIAMLIGWLGFTIRQITK